MAEFETLLLKAQAGEAGMMEARQWAKRQSEAANATQDSPARRTARRVTRGVYAQIMQNRPESGPRAVELAKLLVSTGN